MSGKRSGLPDNWLSRDEAEASMYVGTAHEVPDQPVFPASEIASKSASDSASESASVDVDPQEGEKVDVVSTIKGPVAPPAPPAKKRPARVQFNHRILADRDKKLQKYKTANNTTMQAIVDQMVDEYLRARGLLPDGNDD